MSPHRSDGRSSGFTIVELLITIAIISILIGLLLTGLRSARGTAKETQQMSSLRQLYTAWSVYAAQYDDACMPGFLSPDVQTNWKLKVRNQSGQVIDPLLAQTYPWRLGGFLDFNTELMIGYLGRADADFTTSYYESGQGSYALPSQFANATALPGSAAAIQPEFGYNAFYLGGWWEMENNIARPRFVNAKHPTTGAAVIPVARTISQIARPELMVVFSGATYSTPGLIKDVSEEIPGAAWVTPPFLAQTQIWTTGPVGDTSSIDVLEQQAVPLKRFNAVVLTAADGSARKASYRELWDMSLWTNRSGLTEAELLQPVHTED